MRTLEKIAECVLTFILASVIMATIMFALIVLCPPFAEVVIEVVREGVADWPT